MKVILIENVDKLGKKNDLKNVADGFARNYLLPKKLAVFYNEIIYKKILQNSINKGVNNKQEQLDLKAEQFILTFNENCTPAGNLFAQINRKRIIDQLNNIYKLSLNTKDLIINQPIKKIGEYLVGIKPNYYDKIKLIVKKYENN